MRRMGLFRPGIVRYRLRDEGVGRGSERGCEMRSGGEGGGDDGGE